MRIYLALNSAEVLMVVSCLDEEVDVLGRGDAHVGRLDRALQALDHPLGVVVVLGLLLPTQSQTASSAEDNRRVYVQVCVCLGTRERNV
jgi:hypothetical protein